MLDSFTKYDGLDWVAAPAETGLEAEEEKY